MFQRKLIAVFGVVALLALTAGVSQASLSRVEGMGLTAPTLSQFTDDYVNIFYYPTSVVRQNNLVLAEMGNNPSGAVNSVAFNDQSLTLIKNFPHFGTLAYQMKQSALNSQFSSILNNEQFDLIYGVGLSNLDLAVRFDMTNSSIEYDDNVGPTHAESHGNGPYSVFDPYPFGAAFGPNAIVGTGTEINTWGVSPAIALHLSNDNRVEGMVGFRRYSLDRNITTGGVDGEQWKDAGNISYAIAARAILHQGDRGTWYPAFWYVNDDLSYSIDNLAGLGPRGADETYKTAGLGISHNMRVNDNNLLVFGVLVSQSKSSFERTDNNDGVVTTDTKTEEVKSTTAPTVFASLETQLTHWLTGRLGASKTTLMTEDKTTDFGAPTVQVTNKDRTSDFQFSLGTGIKFNNFDIDMTLNEAFPLSGGWILSGDPATPFTRVSGTYHF